MLHVLGMGNEIYLLWMQAVTPLVMKMIMNYTVMVKEQVSTLCSVVRTMLFGLQPNVKNAAVK